ncbi:MAG TPA: methyltransferase [Thermoanaerobaculia bacterium]|nr:methyltransferase [Thermoanaerobaculia bacterium]
MARGSVRPFDARLPFTIPAWAFPFGLALAIVGSLIALWCIVTFVARGRGTPAPFDSPREFVAAGPYRYVRNPMYVGAFGVIAGAGLALRSPAPPEILPGVLTEECLALLRERRPPRPL